jgi:hypothetical protein
MYFEVCWRVAWFLPQRQYTKYPVEGYGRSVSKTVTYSQNMIIKELLGNGFDLSNKTKYLNSHC